jgi:hypothetical protein
MMREFIEDLVDLANELDKNDSMALADTITYFVKVAADNKDHEVNMAKNDLSTAMRAIQDLLKNLPEEETDLPAWWQVKLSRACMMIDGLADYYKSEKKQVTASDKNKGKKLNKPFRTPGGPKKFSVYVKNDKGNIIKVNFGDPKLSIKRDNPERRKNFRARHNCDSDPRAKDKTTAKYWSCKFWSKKNVSDLT